MPTAISYPHIVNDPGEPARLERHPRTRVALLVMDYLTRGMSPEEIVRHYPYLTLSEVHAAMTYYHDHRDEVDSEIDSELEKLKNGPHANSQSAVWLKLKAKGLP